MNKEFVVIDDKVVVKDDDKLQESIEYQDNIKEVLKQENRIEEIKKQIKELEPLINKYSESKKSSWLIYVVTSFLTSLFALPIVLGLLMLIDGDFMSIFLDNISFLIIIEKSLVISYTSFGAMFSFSVHHSNKRDERLYKGRKSEYEYLSKKLQKEEEKLKELQENNTKERISENQNNVVEIEEDKVFLEEIENKKDLYFELGVKMYKYQKLLMKGKLRKELLKTHNEEDAIYIQEIVSDNSQKRLEYTP